MKNGLKLFCIISIISFYASSKLIGANKNLECINTPYNNKFRQYIELHTPRLIEQTELKAPRAYSTLLDNDLPQNTKWSSFFLEWESLNQRDKDIIIDILSQQSLQKVLIMEQDFIKVKLWVESLCGEDTYFECSKTHMAYLDFSNPIKTINKTNIIEWVYLPNKQD